jgi:guanylate kinase
MVIVVSGPGGVGKGTIAELLVEKHGDLWLSRSWTSRAPRKGEGEDSYVFVSEEMFKEAIDSDSFLEWAEFHGNFYGTPWPVTPEGHDVLLEIDVQGALSVQARGIDFLMIFVDAPTKEDQAERLLGRGDSEDEVHRRIVEGERERKVASGLGAIFVINADLDKAVDEISTIISLYRSK